MNVYEVSANAKPKGTQFPHYGPVVCVKADEKFFNWDDFDGKPFPRKWWPLTVYFSMPSLPRADFSNFGGVSGFAMNRR